MHHIEGVVRRCIEDFHMIAPGDHIAVGVSGGKDSLLLLAALCALKRYLPVPFTLHAITLSMGFPGVDFSPVAQLCRAWDVPFSLIETRIGTLLFEERREKNPCSLCAKLRRGILYRTAIEAGCNKAALGHHRDDAVETLLLSLFFEGRMHCFRPVTYLDRRGITLIRPLLYLPESDVTAAATRLGLPVTHNPCPANGETKRQEIKELTLSLEKHDPHLRHKLMNALQNSPLPGWQTGDIS